MNTKIVAFYSIFIGLAVTAMWTLILLGESLPEGKIELSFHLFSEFLMAATCATSGFLLLKQVKNARIINAAGLGMVIYSVLNAAGYYGQQMEIPMLGLFCLLFTITTTVFIFSLERSTKQKHK